MVLEKCSSKKYILYYLLLGEEKPMDWVNFFSEINMGDTKIIMLSKLHKLIIHGFLLVNTFFMILVVSICKRQLAHETFLNII